jgi:transcriptional regulator with XRE-family HTH domain
VPIDPLHRELARRITAAAKKRGMSINQLADFAGIGRGFASELLRGNKSPTIRTLKKISDALGVDLRDLVPTNK